MKQGTQYISLLVDKMVIKVGDNDVVENTVPFMLEVKFYYEEAIKATEDEPPCLQYILPLKVFVNTPVYLGNGKGLAVSITQEAELEDLLTFDQITKIIDAIKESAATGDSLYGKVTLD